MRSRAAALATYQQYRRDQLRHMKSLVNDTRSKANSSSAAVQRRDSDATPQCPQPAAKAAGYLQPLGVHSATACQSSRKSDLIAVQAERTANVPVHAGHTQQQRYQRYL